LIVERSVPGEAGTDFLVKYKKGKKQRPACTYVVEPGDLEIHNEAAEYFIAIKGNLLIVDSGPGVEPRSLLIWDLEQQKMAYSGEYFSKDMKIDTGSIEFWMPSGETVTEGNCPEAEKWSDRGLGAGIDTWVRLDLSDFTVAETSKTRCSPRK
jgi:hypothetical protein